MADQHSLTLTEAIAASAPLDGAIEGLIARGRRGDQQALVAIHRQYSGQLYRLLYSMLQNQEDAEEVLQDSFEYAFRRLNHFDSRKASFKTWLYRIAVSRCRNKRRRKWLPSVSLQQLVGREVQDHDVRPLDESAALSERQQVVWDALGQLSDKLRDVAIMRYYGGLRYNEIGDILGIPPKTAESRMRLAHKALREHLEGVLD